MRKRKGGREGQRKRKERIEKEGESVGEKEAGREGSKKRKEEKEI